MSFPWIRTAAATLLVTVAAAGCGSDADSAIDSPPTTTKTTAAPAATPAATPTPAGVAGLDAKAIFARTKAAAFAADSVRLRGSFADSGETTVIDVQLTRTGGQGTFTVGGKPLSITVIGKVVYLQLSEKFIRAEGKANKDSAADINATVRVLKGKWIKLSKPGGDFDDLIRLTTRDSFFADILRPSGKLTKTPQKTVDGVPSIGLSDGEGTLWVDTVTARPVRLETPSDGAGEALRFSDYNRLKAPKVPPAAKTLDGRQFGL
jgi:hypothetical protein